MPKPPIAKRVSILSSYDTFTQKYEVAPIKVGLYNKILKLFFTKLIRDIILTGKPFKLPKGIGTFQCKKKQARHKPVVDYKATKEVFGEHNTNNPNNKKVVKFMNRATKGFIPVFIWNKEGCNWNNTDRWTFKLSRPNRRPNKTNKNNPEVSLVPYFHREGFRKYEIDWI
jgi:nucleoid DNA-binding protein